MSHVNNNPYDQDNPGSREYIPCPPPTPMSSAVPSPMNKPLRWLAEEPSSLKHDLTDDSDTDVAEPPVSTAADITQKTKKETRVSKKLRREEENGAQGTSSPSAALDTNGGELNPIPLKSNKSGKGGYKNVTGVTNNAQLNGSGAPKDNNSGRTTENSIDGKNGTAAKSPASKQNHRRGTTINRPAYKDLFNTSQLQLTEAKTTIVQLNNKITNLTEENETLHHTVANLHGFLNSLACTEGGTDVVQLLREKDYKNWTLEEEIGRLKSQLAVEGLRVAQKQYGRFPEEEGGNGDDEEGYLGEGEEEGDELEGGGGKGGDQPTD